MQDSIQDQTPSDVEPLEQSSDLLAEDQKTEEIKPIAITPERPLYSWSRQPNESNEAWEAFSLYLESNKETKTSRLKVAKVLGKSRQLLDVWASKHHWNVRLREYQNHQILLQEREQQYAIREAAREWARRRVDIRDTGFSIGLRMIKRAEALLQLPVANRKVTSMATDAITNEIIVDSSGRPVEQTIVYEFQQHPRDARMFADTGLRLMRLSADMSTENVNMVNDKIDFNKMTDEELEAYAESLEKMKLEAVSNGHIPGRSLYAKPEED